MNLLWHNHSCFEQVAKDTSNMYYPEQSIVLTKHEFHVCKTLDLLIEVPYVRIAFFHLRL